MVDLLDCVRLLIKLAVQHIFGCFPSMWNQKYLFFLLLVSCNTICSFKLVLTYLKFTSTTYFSLLSLECFIILDEVESQLSTSSFFKYYIEMNY